MARPLKFEGDGLVFPPRLRKSFNERGLNKNRKIFCEMSPCCV
jgi:hypothetical protein